MDKDQRRQKQKIGNREADNTPAASAQSLLEEGFKHHQEGRLQQAEELYRQALRADPDNPDGLNLLAIIADTTARGEEAIKLMEAAVAAAPENSELSNNLGQLYKKSGRINEAIGVYRAAINVDPNNADAHNNLGNALTMTEEVGVGEAIGHYRKALEIDPNNARTQYNLASVLLEQGDLLGAIETFQTVVTIEPNYIEAHNNLGNAYLEQGKLDEAVDSYHKALAIKPDYAEAHSNLGNAYLEQGKLDKAVDSYHKALAIKPDYAEAHNNLGNAYKEQAKLDEALTNYHKALAIKPDYAEAHSNLIFCMANSPDYGPEEILKEARLWNKTHAQPLAPETVRYANIPDPERRLKIGYFSADLRSHPVGFFMESVFQHHDKNGFVIHVYSTTRKADDVTDRIRKNVDVWHDATALIPKALAEAIKEESIDILIELSGHAAGNRLLTLARRPAPVQILGVGHFCTSGLDCVDGLLSDRFETPEGTDKYFSEPLIRLPDGNICYRPPDYATDVGPSPCLKNGYITFGCFNNLSKISEPTIALWAKILKQVPESRLLMKAIALTSERARTRLISLFTDHGVAEDRLLLEPGLPHPAFMAEYGRVDIGLDPFPYSGGLTTIEALWMGVPVITLSGKTFAARHSTSHLNNSGLEELICETPGAYVNKVMEISADYEALNALRLSIRPKIAASPILDGARYTRNLEGTFRQLWCKWCDKS